MIIQYSIFRNQKNTKILRASLFLDQKKLEELLSQARMKLFYTPPGAQKKRSKFHVEVDVTDQQKKLPRFVNLDLPLHRSPWPKKKGDRKPQYLSHLRSSFFPASLWQAVWGNSDRVHERLCLGLDTTTSKVSTSRKPVRVGINASEVILQPSPTLFKGSTQFKGGTHNHSTARLQLPSLEFSSCTPCNAPFLFLRYEELDQAAVDLCVDISTR